MAYREVLEERIKAIWGSRTAFAAACDVSTVTVRNWIAGRTTPNPVSKRKVAGLLVWNYYELDEALKAQPAPLRPERGKAILGAGPIPAIHPEYLRHTLAEHWHYLVQQDNLLGQEFAIRPTLETLDLLQRLMGQTTRDERHHAERLAVQYAEFAAWLYQDRGDHPAAHYWLESARSWAFSGRHPDLLSWVYFRQSCQALRMGDPHSATRSQTILSSADTDGRPTPTMGAALKMHRARIAAVLGDERNMNAELDAARSQSCPDTDGDARSGHGSFATPEHLELERAWCWLALGEPKRAVELFDQYLAVLPPVYRRNSGVFQAWYSLALLRSGHIDTAAGTARRALRLVADVGSGRGIAIIRRVGDEMERNSRATRAHQLHKALRDVREPTI